MFKKYGLFFLIIMVAIGCYLFLNHHRSEISQQSHTSQTCMNEYSTTDSVVIQSIKNQEPYTRATAHNLDEHRLQEFKKFAEQSREKLNIPGAAIAIVQHGKIIFAQGFGVKELGKLDPVTPDTLFMIGSITKSLTSFMMAKLIDEGKFSWDTLVTNVMPTFAVGDKKLTAQLEIKDMVAMHSGMPRQEAARNYTKLTPETFMAAMHKIKPIHGYHKKFEYSNDMVAAGGYIAAYALYKNQTIGQAYDAAMQHYVFDPISMPATTLNFDKAIHSNHAQPHQSNKKKHSYKPLPIDEERFLIPLRPAGGAWSNVHDMANYIITELNNGVNAKGHRIISQENLLHRRKAQVKIMDRADYGLGIGMFEEKGIAVAGHGGGTYGFNSDLCFLPDHNVGIITLTNVENAQEFTFAIWHKFMDLLFIE